MIGRATAILNQTIKFTASATSHAAQSRPQILHQLGVNCRWSPLLVDEQPHASEEGVRNAGAYLVEDPSALYAGDRAPEAPQLQPVEVGKEEKAKTSLFKIFGPTHHTVLIFGADATSKELVAVLQGCPEGTVTTVAVLPKGSAPTPAEGADLTLIDTEDHAHTAYPPAAAGFPVIIVRPDGVVGAVARGVEGAKRYFDSIFKHN